jgi:hypothetical protein
LAEIAAGKIKPIMPEHRESLVEDEIPMIVGETRPAEFGVLLPALDETEALIAVDDEEHEGEAEADETLSLSDLVGEEEEEVAAPSEEDTLSLSDIAEEETSEEETEE